MYRQGEEVDEGASVGNAERPSGGDLTWPEPEPAQELHERPDSGVLLHGPRLTACTSATGQSQPNPDKDER